MYRSTVLALSWPQRHCVRRISSPPTTRQYVPVHSPSNTLSGKASMSEEHHHQQPGNTYRSTVPMRSWPERHLCQKNTTTNSTYLSTVPVKSWPEEHHHQKQPGNTYRSTVPVKSWPERHLCQKNTTTNSQAVHTGQQSQ